MYRFLFRFVVMTITILTANLLTTAISGHLVNYKTHYKPVTFTFIGMAVIVLVFYPLFIKLEGWVMSISVHAVRKGNSVAGKYLGLLLTFAAGILILFYFYAKMWYHLGLLDMMKF